MLAGCKKPADAANKKDAEAAPLLLSREDVISLKNSALTSGPSITGSIEPERRADLRAEVSAVVLAVLKENGDPVKKRRPARAPRPDLDPRQPQFGAGVDDARPAQAFEQAERQFQRMKTLRETGVVSAQQLEDVEIRRNTAQSEREAARTRVVTARQQLERTEVRAPFDGIVSDRKVSAGDTAAIGKELLKVIDPSSACASKASCPPTASAKSRPVSTSGSASTASRPRIHGRRHARESGRQHRPRARSKCSWSSTTRRSSRTSRACMRKAASRLAPAATLSLPGASLVREGDNAFAWRVKAVNWRRSRWRSASAMPAPARSRCKSGLAEGDQVLRFPNCDAEGRAGSADRRRREARAWSQRNKTRNQGASSRCSSPTSASSSRSRRSPSSSCSCAWGCSR